MNIKNLSALKIHKLTKAQYDRELAAGRIDENALYLTPDEEIDLSIYETIKNSESKLSEAKQYTDSIKTSLINGAGTGRDTLKELSELIDDNQEAIEAVETAVAGKQTTITGAASSITSSNLAANRVLISNDSGKVGASAVTTTELGYLDGATGNIQAQLDNKLSLSGGTISRNEPITSILTLDNIGSNNSWLYFNSKGTPIASAGYYDGIASIANEKNLARIGVADDGTPQYRTGTAASTAKTLVHSGNIGLYNAGSATLLKPTDNTSTVSASVSTWDANSTSGKVVWREAFKESSYGTDSGDIVLWVNKNASANGTELNMTIDGNFYAEQNKQVIHTGNIGSQSVAYASAAGTATKATQDSSGNIISSTYLPKSGGTMTGGIIFSKSTITPLTFYEGEGGLKTDIYGNFIAGTSAVSWNLMDKNQNPVFTVNWDTGNTAIKGNMSVNSIKTNHVHLGIDYALNIQPTGTGWYRIWQGSHSNSSASGCIFTISRNYYSPQNEQYTFSVNIGYNGDISITQLSGTMGGYLITKIRVVWKNSGNVYIDFYTGANRSDYSNTYYVNGIGAGTFQIPTFVSSLESDYEVTEFTTTAGCKSNQGFVGNLAGKATNADYDANGQYIPDYYETKLDSQSKFSNLQSQVNLKHQTHTQPIFIEGDSNIYYPVRIGMTYSKAERSTISIWKDLGTTTPSYEGNHSGGTSSMWFIYEGRNGGWDGNGGYLKTLYRYMGYADLCANAQLMNGPSGDFVIWLRGGGCSYNISTSFETTVSVYYEDTNLGYDPYNVIVSPRDTIGNGGVYSTAVLGYGSVMGTASQAIQDGNGNTITSTYLPLSGGTMTGALTYSMESSSYKPNNYISAGGGYSVNSGRYGIKLVCCDQSDCQSGLGQDLTSLSGGYELTVAGGRSTDGTGYISFALHDVNSTGYSRLGYFDASGNLYTSGSIYSNGSPVITSNNISSQSVNYATSAGSVAWGNVSSKPSSFTPSAHNQAASTITAGTLAGKVNANATAAATVGNAQVRDIYAGTSDMTAGSSALTSGTIYLVYE